MVLWPNSGCRPLREYNRCHHPKGAATGGQFCAGAGGVAAAPRLSVSAEPQVTKAQVAFESLGKRKFMYNPATRVLVLGKVPEPGAGWQSGEGGGTHAEIFVDLKAPGDYDDYVRGFLDKSGTRTTINVYGFTGGGIGGDSDRAIDMQLRTMEYLVKAGAPAETVLFVVRSQVDYFGGGRSSGTLGALLPELYGRRQTRPRQPRRRAA